MNTYHSELRANMGERGQRLGLMLHMLMWWSLSFLLCICLIRCPYSHLREIGIVLEIVHEIIVWTITCNLLLLLKIGILMESISFSVSEIALSI